MADRDLPSVALNENESMMVVIIGTRLNDFPRFVHQLVDKSERRLVVVPVHVRQFAGVFDDHDGILVFQRTP